MRVSGMQQFSAESYAPNISEVVRRLGNPTMREILGVLATYRDHFIISEVQKAIRGGYLVALYEQDKRGVIRQIRFRATNKRMRRKQTRMEQMDEGEIARIRDEYKSGVKRSILAAKYRLTAYQIAKITGTTMRRYRTA